MAANEKMSYYCVIPATVMLDKELPDKAKLLYGHIAGLANERGYCWAVNKYFEDMFDVTERTIIRLLNELIDKKYIYKEIIYSEENTEQIIERRLYLTEPTISRKK